MEWCQAVTGEELFSSSINDISVKWNMVLEEYEAILNYKKFLEQNPRKAGQGNFSFRVLTLD